MTGIELTSWNQIVPESPLPGIQRQTIHGERQTVARYVYGPGSVFPLHSHEAEQITIVVSGRIVFTVGGERVELGPGDVCVLPGGVEHGAVVEGRETVVTINTISPRRDTFPSD